MSVLTAYQFDRHIHMASLGYMVSVELRDWSIACGLTVPCMAAQVPQSTTGEGLELPTATTYTIQLHEVLHKLSMTYCHCNDLSHQLLLNKHCNLHKYYTSEPSHNKCEWLCFNSVFWLL